MCFDIQQAVICAARAHLKAALKTATYLLCFIKLSKTADIELQLQDFCHSIGGYNSALTAYVSVLYVLFYGDYCGRRQTVPPTKKWRGTPNYSTLRSANGMLILGATSATHNKGSLALTQSQRANSKSPPVTKIDPSTICDWEST